MEYHDRTTLGILSIFSTTEPVLYAECGVLTVETVAATPCLSILPIPNLMYRHSVKLKSPIH